jgi:tetratricopeptide (TPR) repeat protein
MRSGNATEAELEFKQMTLAYPRLSTPYVNLGILYRKAGHLDQSEEALKGAVERNGTSAVAWNELGATQRLRGEFPDAAASYEKAIAADSNYAPAYRNLGVVSDLYLGDPERALTALERYKELTNEDRPVTSWIAELRQRTGKPPLKPAGAGSPAGAAAPSSDQGANTGASAAGAAPAGTPPAGNPAPTKESTSPTKTAPKAGG